MSNEQKKPEIFVDDSIVNILNEDEDTILRSYAEKYLNKTPSERLSEIQKELLKTLIYIDKQLKEIDELTEGKGFHRSVYEQKNALIGQRISILKQLADMQFKQEEYETEDVESIKDLFTK
jgi:N-dimethylarginine dimethylaminohydrolase